MSVLRVAAVVAVLVPVRPPSEWGVAAQLKVVETAEKTYIQIDAKAAFNPLLSTLPTYHDTVPKADKALLAIGTDPVSADYPLAGGYLAATCSQSGGQKGAWWQITSKTDQPGAAMAAVRLYNHRDDPHRLNGATMKIYSSLASVDADTPDKVIPSADINVQEVDLGGTLIEFGEELPVYRLRLQLGPGGNHITLCGFEAFIQLTSFFLTQGVKLNKKRHALGEELLPLVNQRYWGPNDWEEVDAGVLLPNAPNTTAGGLHKDRNSATIAPASGEVLERLSVTVDWNDQEWGNRKGGLRVDLVRAGSATTTSTAAPATPAPPVTPAPPPGFGGFSPPSGGGGASSWRVLTTADLPEPVYVIASSWIEFAPHERQTETFEFVRFQDDIVTHALEGDHIRFSARVGEYSHKIFLHRLEAAVTYAPYVPPPPPPSSRRRVSATKSGGEADL